MVQLQNCTYTATINPHGAELTSLIHTTTNTQLIWQANPLFWAKHSPILFPIVGTLKNNSYTYNGQSYTLPRHGFARNQLFTITHQTATTASFSLTQNQNTLAVYPFNFTLNVLYKLTNTGLQVQYTVTNSGTQNLPFSLGAHPAFNVPLFANQSFNNFSLHFDTETSLQRHKLNAAGLFNGQTEVLQLNNHTLPLHHQLFAADAIVVKNLASKKIQLLNQQQKGLVFTFNNFAHFGIWTVANAPFICLEPWQGHADYESHNGNLVEKAGIIQLSPNSNWQAGWAVNLVY
jgi:galactose mutarotase-like enzyme